MKGIPATITPEHYVAADGHICPACRDTHVYSMGRARLETPTKAFLTVECGNCGAVWEEEFTLSGFSALRRRD